MNGIKIINKIINSPFRKLLERSGVDFATAIKGGNFTENFLSEKSALNLVKLTKIWIIMTLFRLIWHQ